MGTEDVEKAQNGDKKAFETIIMAVIDSMYRVAYEKINTLKNKEYFKTWVTRILINECNSIIKQKKKVVYIENYIENQDNFYTNENEISIDVKETMKKLDENLNQIVILWHN